MKGMNGSEVCESCGVETGYIHCLNDGPVLRCKGCDNVISKCDICKGSHHEKECLDPCVNGSQFEVAEKLIAREDNIQILNITVNKSFSEANVEIAFGELLTLEQTNKLAKELSPTVNLLIDIIKSKLYGKESTLLKLPSIEIDDTKYDEEE
jgi:hypothetical protein